MDTFLKRWTKGERLALVLPMLGFIVMWLACLFATYYNIYKPNPYDANGNQVTLNWYSWDTYMMLVGLAAVNIGSLCARGIAQKSRETRLGHLAFGYSTVALIISLVAGAIFGIATFMSTFVDYGAPSGIYRAVSVYVPILLDAALLIFVILKAFVGAKGEDDE